MAIARLRRGLAAQIECFGVADTVSRWPVRADTTFEAASLSKPLFAFALLKAASAGTIGLDRPLVEYLPAPYRHAQDARFDDVRDPRVAQITARMVLAHTSGFPNWSLDAPLPIQFAPGTRWQYSSEGYVYLQRALERRLGEALEPFMQRTALVPLGMTQSSYETARSPMARGYDEQGQPVDSVLTAMPDGAPSVFVHPLASTTLRTTVADYARFVQRVLDAPASDSTVAALLRPEIVVDRARGISWGDGFALSREGHDAFFFHSGSSPGACSLVFGSRTRGEAMALLSNADGGRDAEVEIVRALYGDLSLAAFVSAPH